MATYNRYNPVEPDKKNRYNPIVSTPVTPAPVANVVEPIRQVPTTQSLGPRIPETKDQYGLPKSTLSQGDLTPKKDSIWTNIAKTLLPKKAEDFFGLNDSQIQKDIKTSEAAKQYEFAGGKSKFAGFAESMTDWDTKDIPLFGSGKEAVESVGLAQSAGRFEKDKATETDVAKLQKYYEASEAQAGKMRNTGYAAGETVKGSLRFMGELLPVVISELFTLGAAPTGDAWVLGQASKLGAKKTLEKYAKDKVFRTALTSAVKNKAKLEAATLAKQFAITAPTNITDKTAQRMIGDYDFETGKVIEAGQPIGDALVNGISQHTVELLSERTGGLTGKMLGKLAKPVKNIAVKTSIYQALQKALPRASNSQLTAILKKTGWNGVVGEFFEERDADALNQILYEVGLGDQPFNGLTMDQITTELIAFSIMGAGVRVAEYTYDNNIQPGLSIKDVSGDDVIEPKIQRETDVVELLREKYGDTVPLYHSGETVNGNLVGLENSRLGSAGIYFTIGKPVYDRGDVYRYDVPVEEFIKMVEPDLEDTNFIDGEAFEKTFNAKERDYSVEDRAWSSWLHQNNGNPEGIQVVVRDFENGGAIEIPGDKLTNEAQQTSTKKSLFSGSKINAVNIPESIKNMQPGLSIKDVSGGEQQETKLPSVVPIESTTLQNIRDGKTRFKTDDELLNYVAHGPSGEGQIMLNKEEFLQLNRIMASIENEENKKHRGLVTKGRYTSKGGDVYLGAVRNDTGEGWGGENYVVAETDKNGKFTGGVRVHGTHLEISGNKIIKRYNLEPLALGAASISQQPAEKTEINKPLFSGSKINAVNIPVRQTNEQMELPTPTVGAAMFDGIRTREQVGAESPTEEYEEDKSPEEITPLEREVTKKENTPLEKRVTRIDMLRTPWKVLDKIGLRAQYNKLLKAYEAYVKELPINIDRITAWSKRVTKKSNERIFRYLDGEDIELYGEEIIVAKEIKDWLEQWADRLGMAPDERISEYITHIFPIDSKGEIPEELAVLINKKVAKSVYNPFLLQRQGAEGYLKDTWKALDAYVKRGTRKANMDPALKAFDEASKKLTDVSQLNYVERYISRINMRPTEQDIQWDNLVKRYFGYTFGARPINNITRTLRQLISRAKIGGSLTSFAKNLTQGVNTFAELGTRYTLKGYLSLLKKGGAAELKENNVFMGSFIEDRTYSAVKKAAEIADKVLFLNMQASENVNRGAAYFGAKAKFATGKIKPHEFREALGRNMPANYQPTMEDAIEYGKFVAGKTQFRFDMLETPLALSSDIAKTAAQFQTFGLKQAEFILGMMSWRDKAKLFRYMYSSMLLFHFIGGAFGMSWDDSFKTFRWGYPPILQFIKDLWEGGVLGEDKYGNKLDAGQRAKMVGKSLFTNVVPGGAQMQRTFQGIGAVNEGKSKTKSGRFEYKIDQTPQNYIRGALFGKDNLPQAKEYYKKKKEKAKTKTKHNRYDPI